MPFTFSHPAYILPAKYFPAKYISLTGLVIGSIAPDFEYFARMNVDSFHSHYLLGILYLNLPVTIVVSLIFHLLIKEVLFKYSPAFVSSRFTELVKADFISYLKKNSLVFIFSALVGIASHLFIDAFTHKHGYFVNQFSVLQHPCNVLGMDLLWYRFLQHITSIIGLLILGIYILKLPVDKEYKKVNTKNIVLYWTLLLMVTGLFLFLRYTFGPQTSRLSYWAINAISCGLMALFVVSVSWKFIEK